MLKKGGGEKRKIHPPAVGGHTLTWVGGLDRPFLYNPSIPANNILISVYGVYCKCPVLAPLRGAQIATCELVMQFLRVFATQTYKYTITTYILC